MKTLNVIQKFSKDELICPKEREANLEFRRKLLEKCAVDYEMRNAVWFACKHDILFFFNAFCWVYEPRDRYDDQGVMLPKKLPFITWPHQDVAIIKIMENLGLRDIITPKSRGEGMSWIACLLSLHQFVFHRMSKIGIVSENEEKAIDADNTDSLFWKINWELDQLPHWMVGERGTGFRLHKSKGDFVNENNGSTISGCAATGTCFVVVEVHLSSWMNLHSSRLEKHHKRLTPRMELRIAESSFRQ